MNLIVETDIGHDPDDFFALCYLFSAGVDIRAIVISPGDKYQVAIVKFLLKEIGKNIPVGVWKERDKGVAGSIHKDLMKKYGFEDRVDPDGFGSDIIENVMWEYPDCEFFICGPVSNMVCF